MSLYHLSLKTVSRADGKSAIASAAYRNGSTMVDEATGEIKDYSRRSQVHGSMILAPEGAPVWAHDSNTLWNKVESGESNKDGSPKKKARLAYEVEVALQKELTTEQNIEMTKQFVQEQFVSKGFVAELSFHNMKDSENPHCHIMMTTREITPDGFGKKLDRDTFMKREFLQKEVRPNWEKTINETFKENEINEEVSCKSNKSRGIEKKPQIHLGPKVWNALKEGRADNLERADEYVLIQMQNERLEEVNMRMDELNQAKEQVSASVEAPQQIAKPTQVQNHSESTKAPEIESEVSQSVGSETEGKSYTDKLVSLTNQRDAANRTRHSLERQIVGIDNFLAQEKFHESLLKTANRKMDDWNKDYANKPKWLLPKHAKESLERIEKEIHSYEQKLREVKSEKPDKLRQRANIERQAQEQYALVQKKEQEIRKLKENEGPKKGKQKSRSKSKGRDL